MSRRERKAASFGDMARTLAVFVALIGVSLLFVPRHHHDKVTPVDYANDLSVFAHASTFKVLVPQPVPTGWKVTSFEGHALRDGSPSSMHMGMVSTETHYVDLEEGDAPGFGDALLPKSSSFTGTKSAYGPLQWEIYTSKKGDSLVYRGTGSDKRQIVITGGAKRDELAQLAQSLVLASL